MSPQYTVHTTPEAQEAGAVALAVASLPATFGPARSEADADVRVIAGQSGWTSQAMEAIDAGARGIIVVNPVTESVSELEQAAYAHGTAIVLDQRWATNPAVPGAESAIRDMVGRVVLLDSVATASAGSDSRVLLIDQLAAVVRLTGPLENFRLLNQGTRGYTVSAQLANGAPATLQGILSSARPAGLEISLISDDGGARVTLPEPVAAWPAKVAVSGPQGELLLPTLYESAHRATWRRLADHLESDTPARDLSVFSQLAADLSNLTSHLVHN
ncbi:hypothetical protein J2T11_000095 [Paenarthrobacter nicotinovorans]|uniref:hypothetical protein n=1 Tax=Paenarthrobacter nicotinovorans TaxID=29320 RepID=UPI002781E1A1|nr:hypothetical protein [Paenarthrobacter nicotinovorans]MDP9933771.1 hypothetical protein [Paenarthrobacter nicotinovorans]